MAAAAPTTGPCADLLPRIQSASVRHAISASDLARIRDIGDPIYFQTAVGLSVSPNGRSVAFGLRRADPASNDYCLGIVVLALEAGGQARLVDVGGELIRQTYDRYGIKDYPSGNPLVIRPAWSPDGSHVAFLKRTEGHVQAWVAAADGSGSRAVTAEAGDVQNVSWTAAGLLKVSVRSDQAWLADRTKEARTGFLFDERFVPVSSMAPYSTVDAVRFDRFVDMGAPPLPPATGPRNRWIALPFPEGKEGERRVQFSGGTGLVCDKPACFGAILAAWRHSDGSAITFLRREGPANSDMAVYIWKPSRDLLKRTFLTRGLLLGCEPVSSGLICGHEQATRPRHLVLLDPEAGSLIPAFDPNPELAQLTFGRVQRLVWKNDRGIETFGDLVLPPDYRRGRRYPLVVVSYRSRGFLRGGIGDETPIFPLANRGFAVLSFDKPLDLSVVERAGSPEEAGRADRRNWANRWSIQSSLERGIAKAIALGVVDTAHLGITGLSEGASIAWFAMINRPIFRAAVIGSCCEEPLSIATLSGKLAARHFSTVGYPASDENPGFWADYSVARNAAKLRVPTLLQLADREALYGIDSIRALEEKRQPVETYVFPDEEHLKWQPAHRLAIYERTIAWLAFWLKGERPSDAETARRWASMRDRLATVP